MKKIEIEKKGNKRIAHVEDWNSWGFRKWNEKRIYFDNHHRAVGGSKISFYYDIETETINKKMPVLAELQTALLENIKEIMIAC